MKRYIQTYLQNFKKYVVEISGYSKLFHWEFKNLIKVKHILSKFSPKMLARLMVRHVCIVSHRLRTSIARAKSKIDFSNHIIIQQISKTGFRNRIHWIYINNYTVKHLLHHFRAKLHLVKSYLIQKSILVKQNAWMKTAIFYKLKEWDFDNNNPTLFYTLADLDNLTLAQMDIKNQ